MGKSNTNGYSKEDVDVMAETNRIILAMPHLDRIAKLADFAGLKVAAASHEGAANTVKATGNRLHTERLQLDGSRTDVRKRIKKVRALVAGTYGDDSEEVAMVGYKRISQRKRPVRPRKAAKKADEGAAKSPKEAAAPTGN